MVERSELQRAIALPDIPTLIDIEGRYATEVGTFFLSLKACGL